MSDEAPRRPFALVIIAAIYLFSLLLAVSNYGHPFPFMGRFCQGGAGERLVFGDSIICLYLFLGILKRQRLTVWLLIGYNLLDICNACVNLALIPVGAYAQLAGTPIPEAELRFSTIGAALLLILLSVYVFGNRRHFNNSSPYLF
ncbi:MAG: hypothetical protein A2075_22480 [Geobacteraceae bacterium GWC2_58_44]|nr:MAG: hypothetical protein A2075_22480 [Geobacteraceae bacterium GWC2_58_44]HBG04037.1 hypothetical protein [Geobacter sp.]